MGSFSNYFPTAGGGGGIGKTVTVGDYSYPNAIGIDDWATTRTTITSNQTSYAGRIKYHLPQSAHSDVYSLVTANSNGNYQTIVDITSATNGGALYYVSTYKNITYNHAGDITFRITIDGTSYEYDHRYNTNCVYLAEIGMSEKVFQNFTSAGQGATAVTNMLGNQADSSTLNSFGSTYTDADGGYLEFTNSDAWATISPYFPTQYRTMGMPYIHFETSCKVEVSISIYSDEHTASAIIHQF